MINKLTLFFFSSPFLWGCNSKTLFQEVLPEQSGVYFENKVEQVGENNVLNYSYFFNGGGIAVGDINNDGLPDLYFSGNMTSNKLYLNKGNLVFEDITDKAGVSAKEGWKTGVLFTDINQDGWLDLYVCRSAMSDSVLRENLLFINNGDLTFSEKGREYGVGDNAYSIHAAFFDYDRDGDEDLFTLNHSLPQYAGFNRAIGNSKNKSSKKFGSKLFRNDHGHFTDVSQEAGILHNVLSFGLGIAVSDFNQDGWPDFYVSNDYNEEDYLFMNNQNGTFSNRIKESTTPVFSLSTFGIAPCVIVAGCPISDSTPPNDSAKANIFTLFNTP